MHKRAIKPHFGSVNLYFSNNNLIICFTLVYYVLIYNKCEFDDEWHRDEVEHILVVIISIYICNQCLVIKKWSDSKIDPNNCCNIIVV